MGRPTWPVTLSSERDCQGGVELDRKRTRSRQMASVQLRKDM